MKKNVLIVNYNTTALTSAAIRSLWKHTPGCRVTVFDNSDRKPFAPTVELHGPLEVIDNTHGQIIDFERWLDSFPDKEPSPGNNYGSAKHCYSVQWVIDHSDDPFALMDSDVLIKQDITPFFEHTNCAWAGQLGENVRRRFGYDIQKLQPFLCWLNVPLLREHNISYFNPEYMWNLTTKKPNHRYDTGAWLNRAVSAAGLPVYQLPLNEYILHLGHGSWRDKDTRAWLRENKHLWN